VTKHQIRRRLASLEDVVSPEISTWVDLVIAVDEGRDTIVLSPVMQELYDSICREQEAAEAARPTAQETNKW